eukprot:scaffold35417_cov32-Tisochrysis_lutea.AAC.1
MGNGGRGGDSMEHGCCVWCARGRGLCGLCGARPESHAPARPTISDGGRGRFTSDCSMWAAEAPSAGGLERRRAAASVRSISIETKYKLKS